MNNYILTTEGELYHYGVKGMKWGVRKAQKLQGKAKLARDSAREWDEMARYASAKGKTKRAERFKRYAKEDMADAKNIDQKVKNLQQKDARIKSDIKSYRKAYDKAVDLAEQRDAQWTKVQELRKASGKNWLDRTIRSMKNDTAAAKAYNKAYDKYGKLDERATAADVAMKEAYKKTGKTFVTRVINNARYDF